MTIYRYDASSLIDEVRVVTNATHGHRAYLHARTDATPEQLTEIQRRFSDKGWKTVPISDHGKPLLEVRGFKKIDEFTGYLKNHGWTQGAAQVTKLKSDVITKKEKFANRTLKATGIVYNVGDAAYLTYAWRGFKHDRNHLRKIEGSRDALVATIEELAEKNKEKLAKLGDAASQIEKKFLSKRPTQAAVMKSAKLADKGGVLDVGGGIGYALGSYALTVFGNKDQSQHEIKTNAKKIRGFLMKEGVDVPKDSSAHEATKKEPRTLWQKFQHFGKTHPSEMLNTVYVGVGILLASGAIQRVRANWIKGVPYGSPLHQDVRNDVKDTGLGIVTMTSALIGLLVKEKKREPGEPHKKGLGRAWEWVQEKPLRATGMGYFISTLFHGWATLGKYKAGDQFVRETIKFRGVFVAANILAEVLLFASSKGHGQGVKTDHSTDDTVIAMSAELIAKQNPAYQNQLIQQVAGFMASPEVLGGKAETIASKLREQVAVMQNNPWVKKSSAKTQEVVKEAPAAHTPKTQIDADSVETKPRKILPPVESLDTGMAHV